MRTANISLIVAIAALSIAAFYAAAQLPAGSRVEAVSPPRKSAAYGAGVPTAASTLASPPTTLADTASTIEFSESTTAHVADDEATARGKAALAHIDFPWEERLAGWTFQFQSATKGAYGYTLTEENRIDIYVRADQSEELLAHVIAHELGHAVDVTLNDGDARRRWQAARGIDDAPWWPDSGAADFATGAGDFAESFAAWQLGSGSFRSELADPPTSDQLSLIAELAG